MGKTEIRVLPPPLHSFHAIISTQTRRVPSPNISSRITSESSTSPFANRPCSCPEGHLPIRSQTRPRPHWKWVAVTHRIVASKSESSDVVDVVNVVDIVVQPGPAERLLLAGAPWTSPDCFSGSDIASRPARRKPVELSLLVPVVYLLDSLVQEP